MGIFEGSSHSLILKEELESVFPLVLVPGIEILPLREVNLHVGDLKGDSFIGVSCKEQVLIFFIYGLHFLFVRTHDAVLRQQLWLDFRVLNFEKERLLTSLWVLLLNHAVPGPPDLLDIALRQSYLGLRQVNVVLLLSKLPSVKVSLMFLASSVSQIRSLICVQGETETAFEGPQVVPHDIWVI